jgi:hypothetical protein
MVGLVALVLVDLVVDEELLPAAISGAYFGFLVAASALRATAVLYAVACSVALIDPSGLALLTM